MIVDFHHHLLAEPTDYVDRLLIAMEDCGIDRVCLNGLGVPSDNWLGNTAPGNDDVLRARDRSERIVPIAVIRMGVDTPASVRTLHSQGFVGLKTTRPLVNYDDPRLDDVYAQASELRLPILFHTGFIVPSRHDAIDDVSSARTRPELLDRVARMFPDLPIVMAHLGMPWFEAAGQMCRFFPNVFTDLTGSRLGWRNRMAPGGLRDIFNWPGAMEKVIFGTDVPNAEIAEVKADHARILELLDVDADTTAAIFGGTAARLLGIES